MLQPIFTREFKILGKDQSVEVVLNFLKNKYKNVDLRFSEENEHFKPLERTYQVLNLKDEFALNYSTNAKRLIKKSTKQYTCRKIQDLSAFSKLIEATLAPKIEEFNEVNLDKLKKLMENGQQEMHADCIGIFDSENQFVGAGFFFKHQNTITYLKGAAKENAKKQGAMFGLIDYALNLYSKGYEVFDFGGSDIKNVADFYRKFGATNRIYYHYELNNLPFWYRWAKKFIIQR